MNSERFKPNDERQRSIETLSAWFSLRGDGERIGWVDIEQQTSVRMNAYGKTLVPLVLERLHRPYLSIPGYGIELSSAYNGLEIVGGKTRRLLGALQSSRIVTDQVASRHLHEMTQENKNRLLHHKAVFSTLELSSSLAKKLPSALPPKSGAKA